MSFDTPEENKDFAEKFAFQFLLLSDTTREVGLAYGACDDVGAGFARRAGIVVGPDGKVKEYLPKVDAVSYPTEVLARI